MRLRFVCFIALLGAAPQAVALQGAVEFESRLFPESGPKGEARVHASMALDIGTSRTWNDGRDAFT